MGTAPCRKCRMKEKYEKNPRSMLGRLWRWHTKWCPGWKGYMKSLSEEERAEIKEHLDTIARQAK
jgi:hypothetical protein